MDRRRDGQAGGAEAVEREFGPIDVWINNAMATVFAPFDQVTPEEFKRATEVTYLGYVHGTRAALKRMKPRDRGVIVQVGSALAYRSIPLQSAYCGAKHAVAGFTDSIHSELLHDGSNVRITTANMPALNTPQFEWSRSRMPRRPQPVPPIFQPEVAARAVVWAARHPRREVSVGLPTVVAIHVHKIAPGIAERYLAKTGYENQQTEEPSPPDHHDNLFAPLPGHYVAHGRFDERAKEHSVQFWLNRHRSLVALIGGGLAGLAVGALNRRRSWRGGDATGVARMAARRDGAESARRRGERESALPARPERRFAPRGVEERRRAARHSPAAARLTNVWFVGQAVGVDQRLVTRRGNAGGAG